MNMRELYTAIEIDAPKEKVWSVLTDFKGYPLWNPFIKQLKGDVREGNELDITLEAVNSSPMHFTPKVLKLEKNTEFRWLGHLYFKGLFDGEHIFELKSIGENKTLFVHREEFKGMLVPLFWKMIDSNTKQSFELMNKEVKRKSEIN